MNLKYTVLGGAGLLLLLWLGFNFRWLARDSDIIIRLVLGVLFFTLILVRRKRSVAAEAGDEAANAGRAPGASTMLPAWAPAVMAVAGMVVAAAGIVFSIHQFEWIGILLLLCASLQWALPPAYSADILLAVFFIYWIPPLADPVFGPFQLAMQRWSVSGSEWLLHCLNARVWADGMVLCTGTQLFGVPEACSGMRTAVAVLICSAGIGVLLKLGWFRIPLLVAGGIFQVLALNIARITIMVLVAPHIPGEWTKTFLHDTAGILLLAAILLVQLEAWLWNAARTRWQKSRQAAERRRREYDRRVHLPFMRFIDAHGWLTWAVPIVFLSAAVVGMAVYRNTPYHRAMMIRDVVEDLVLTDISHAEKASRAACDLVPGDPDMRLQRVKVLLLCEKFGQALDELKKVPTADREVLVTILKAWGVMGLGRLDEAIALVDSVPADAKTLPGVALVRAEFGAVRDDTRSVVENIVRASHSTWLIRRVRSLFPYLAARQQWETIIRCDLQAVPYDDVTHLLIVLHAYMQTSKRVGMARILDQGLKRWPGEVKFLQYMASLAMDTSESRWERLFAERLKANVENFGADELAVYVEDSFRINRPDLAWLLYSRLQTIDPRDPSLHLLAAQFGDSWFTFRRRQVGLPAAGPYDTIDLRAYYFERLKWPAAPLADKLGNRAGPGLQAERLKLCLDELERRDDDGILSLRLKMMYPVALRLAGKYEDADKRLKDANDLAAQDKERFRSISAIRRRLTMRDLRSAGELMKAAMESWPHEPQVLDCLASLARELPGGEWEKLFAARLTSQQFELGADELSVCIDGAFRINRPDLAWVAYSRLEKLDPKDPMVHLAPALYASHWFVFRKSLAGLPAKSRTETEDLGRLYQESRTWVAAPLAQEMAAGMNEIRVGGYLSACLEEIRRREQAGTISLRMRMMYPTTLGLLGRYGEAHKSLDAIAAAYPAQKREVLYRHALFYHREGKWEEAYETIRDLQVLRQQPRLNVVLMQIDSIMHLDLGSYAMGIADAAAKMFQGAPEIHKAKAAIWATFGSWEEALFELQHVDGYESLPITPGIMWNTGRYSEAQYAAFVQGQKLPKLPPSAGRQPVLLPHAELAVAPQWEEPLDAQGMAAGAAAAKERASKTVSPFVRNLSLLKAGWYGAQGGGDTSEPSKWIAAGRDTNEQGAALSELAMLLGRQKRYDEAAAIVDQALGLLPQSVALRRASVGLRKGSLDVVEDARRACPADPEIWLAYIVAMTAKDGKGSWAVDEIENATAAKKFSAGTMTRAGDFLRRKGIRDAASKCARYAARNCKGLLPAHVLALRCGLLAMDQEWVLLSAREAAVCAVDPLPFYRLIGEIELNGIKVEAGTVGLLEKLRTHFPEEQKWARKLGDVYLRKGDGQNALRVLEALMTSRPENVDLHTLLLTAEAARRMRKLDKSVAILERAHAAYPANRVVLNNLVYSLASDPKTVQRAKALLPKLLDAWGDSFVAFDTAAVVCLNAGEPEKAREYIQKALRAARDIDPQWLERNPTAVDIDSCLGEYNYNLQKELNEFERASKEKWRDELTPMAQDLSRKVKEGAGKR